MRISTLILKLSQLQAQYGNCHVVIPKYIKPKKRKDAEVDEVPETQFGLLTDLAPDDNDVTDADNADASTGYLLLSTQKITPQDQEATSYSDTLADARDAANDNPR